MNLSIVVKSHLSDEQERQLMKLQDMVLLLASPAQLVRHLARSGRVVCGVVV
jgi:hypothetical protein